MTPFRTLLHARRWWAALLVAVTLAVRIVVPAGMMPGHGAHGATLVLCSGHAAATPGMVMGGMAMAGAPDHGRSHPTGADPAKADQPCAYTGLIAAAVDTAAPPPPVAPMLPWMPIAASVMIFIVVRQVRLRPPLRGPPELRAA